MNTELQNKLYTKYPKIFRQRNMSIKETCMCWGFDCADGWYWLIDQLCGCIQSYIDANKIDQIEATQVKEKYGTLSFYTTGGNDTILGMIWLAESMSADICEKCGSQDEVTQTKGWIKTLCKRCLNNE